MKSPEIYIPKHEPYAQFEIANGYLLHVTPNNVTLGRVDGGECVTEYDVAAFMLGSADLQMAQLPSVIAQCGEVLFEMGIRDEPAMKEIGETLAKLVQESLLCVQDALEKSR